MRKKNDNSGEGQGMELQALDIKSNCNIKGVGQECPTQTIEIQAVADDTNKRMGEAVEAAFLAKVCQLRIPVCKPGETAKAMTLWWTGGRAFGGCR
jgi:hypothetical protein